MCLFLKEPQLQMLDFINVLSVIIILHLVVNKILCLIQLTIWISKSQQHLIAITFIFNFIEQEEIPTAKIGKEETLFKFVSLHLMLFSTKILGQLNIKLVMDFMSQIMSQNGLVMKLFQALYLTALNQKFMGVFLDLHSNLKCMFIDPMEIFQVIK